MKEFSSCIGIDISKDTFHVCVKQLVGEQVSIKGTHSLHNSDWVKVGLSFDTKDICPFCQRPYLDDDIIAELRSYFNEDYLSI
jgi:wobble nucleotide-excising tRNase